MYVRQIYTKRILPCNLNVKDSNGLIKSGIIWSEEPYSVSRELRLSNPPWSNDFTLSNDLTWF